MVKQLLDTVDRRSGLLKSLQQEVQQLRRQAQGRHQASAQKQRDREGQVASAAAVEQRYCVELDAQRAAKDKVCRGVGVGEGVLVGGCILMSNNNNSSTIV